MSTNLEELTTCAVCFETLEDAKLLPCHHTFCGTCVRRLIKSGKIRCPTCQNEADAGKIQADFIHTKMMEAITEVQHRAAAAKPGDTEVVHTWHKINTHQCLLKCHSAVRG